jgi:hypothetical protein
MARRGSSFGFLGRFGRSEDLRLLDDALRAFDLHPGRVPEGAKLALVNLMKDHDPAGEPPAHAYPFTAWLFSYCALGAEAFAIANGPQPAETAERRLEAALEAGEGFDADVVLLTLHAKLVHPKLVEQWGLEAGEA